MDASSAVGTWGRRAALVAWLAAGLGDVGNGAGRSPRSGRRSPRTRPGSSTCSAPGSRMRLRSESCRRRVRSRTRRVSSTGPGGRRPSPTPPGARLPRSCSTTGGRSEVSRSSTSLGSLRPDGATSVSLRAAYSETLQFLWSYGNSTLVGRRGRRRHQPQARQRGELRRRRDTRGRRRDGHDRGGRDAIAKHDLVRRRRGGRHEHQGGVHHRDRCRRHDADRHRRHDGVRDRDERRHAGPGGRASRSRLRSPSAHASGAAVLGLGTGVTLTAPLASGHPAGRPRDRDDPRADRRPQRLQRRRRRRRAAPTTSRSRAPGTRRQRANAIQGGAALPGDHADDAGHGVADVGRHPLPPSERLERRLRRATSCPATTQLNKIWYQGAYTNDTDMVPIGAVPQPDDPGDPRRRQARPPAVERRPLVQGRTMFDSLGFGAKGSDYIKSTIGGVRRQPRPPTASIFGHIEQLDASTPPDRRVLLDELLDVLRARPGRLLPVLGRRARSCESQYQTHEERARLQPGARRPEQRACSITGGSERDWDFYDGGKPGAVTAYNAIYYKALTDAAHDGERPRPARPGQPDGRDVAGGRGDVVEPGGRPQAAHQRDAVRRRARRLQARRPRQRQPRGDLGAAGRATPRRSRSGSRRRARTPAS